MTTNLTEGKFLLYTVSAIFLFMTIHIFQPQLNTIYNPSNYTGIHTFLEFLSLAISATIFFYGLKNYTLTRSSRMLLLSFTFFLIGLLDFLHTISFKGMPYFLTESSVAKATWFWIFARIFNSTLMAAILFIPDRKLKKDYRFLSFFFGVLIAAIIGSFVITFEKSLPLLMAEGQGTTPLKNGIEYAVSILLFYSLLFTLYQYYLDKSAAKLSIALAFVFLLLSELVFTVYQSVYDLDNFSGHIFKVAGFYFILKGFYFSVQENEGQEEHRLISELPGFIFKVVKKGDDFISVFCDGELLKQIGLQRDDMIGKSLAKIFSTDSVSIHEYCGLSWRLRETIAFEMFYLDKSLLVSVKPFTDEDGSETLLGTVNDMTGIHNDPSQKQNTRKNFKMVM